MENIIGKGISGKFNFNFGWRYFNLSAGYFFCKKLYIPIFNEFNKSKFISCGEFLQV